MKTLFNLLILVIVAVMYVPLIFVFTLIESVVDYLVSLKSTFNQLFLGREE